MSTHGDHVAIVPSSLPGSGPFSPASMHGARVLSSEPGRCVYAAWHNVLVISWHVAADPAQVSAALDHLAAAYPAGFSCVALVAGTVPIPSNEVRQAVTGSFVRYSDKLACIGVVLEGDGFWASALRSVATAMHLNSPRRATFRIHGEASALDGWFAEEHAKRSGVQFTAAELHPLLNWARGV